MVTMVLGCHAASPAQRVEIQAAPLPAPPPPVTALLHDAALPDAVPVRSEDKGAWARAIAPSKTFKEIAAPRLDAITLAWRIGKQHKVKDLDPSEDYPANYVQPVDLVIGGAADAQAVALGELSGSVERFEVTYCRGRGFQLPREEPWGFPQEPSIASAFSVGVPQGNSEFLVVRDGDDLHVLHRETSDGRCDEMKQGPLDGCEGFEYERIADVHLPHGVALFELVRDEDEGKPLDCGAPTSYGSALLPPR